LPILIPPTAPHSSFIIRDWYNRAVSGRCAEWTQSHPNPSQEGGKKKEKTLAASLTRQRLCSSVTDMYNKTSVLWLQCDMIYFKIELLYTNESNIHKDRNLTLGMNVYLISLDVRCRRLMFEVFLF
jgi:hypothetical protein